MTSEKWPLPWLNGHAEGWAPLRQGDVWAWGGVAAAVIVIVLLIWIKRSGP